MGTSLSVTKTKHSLTVTDCIHSPDQHIKNEMKMWWWWWWWGQDNSYNTVAFNSVEYHLL